MGRKERRRDAIGELRLMAEAEGWVMVRRPGASPITLPKSAWLKLEVVDPSRGA